MTEETKTIQIRFENETLGEANIKARSLREYILDVVPNIQVDIVKEDESMQDFGSTLVLVLMTPAIIALCRGIENYLSSSVGVKLTIEANGKIVAENISSHDAARMVEALAAVFSEKPK